jgi:hypothetical protein
MERENFYVSEIIEDLVTGELLVTIPEQILNEMNWYEGAVLKWTLDDNCALLQEHEQT